MSGKVRGWRLLVRSLALALVFGLALVTEVPPAGPAAAAPDVAAPPTERVGASTDPVLAAVDISRASFRDGAARHVLVGRDDVFADSLAGSILAGRDGPLLYTTGGPGRQPRPEMLAELARVLGSAQGCDGEQRVYLLGGDQAVSTQVEEAVRRAGYCIHRFAGESRVETAVQIAQWVTQGRVPSKVLLARADLWADAATGGAYAAVSGTPILVTQSNRLHPAVDALLRRWRSPVFLLGGTAALNETVEAQVGAIIGHGYRGVSRSAGTARDGTAGQIASHFWTFPHSPLAVVLVSGYREDSWTWALASAPLAARRRAPQLYAQRDTLPPGTQDYLRDWFWGPVIAVGPEDVLSPAAVRVARDRAFPGGDPEGRYKWMVHFDGVPVRWNPCDDVRYVVNPRHVPADAVERVHEAVKRIAEVSGLRFRYLGTTTDRSYRVGGPQRWEPDPRYAPYYAPVLVSFATAEEIPSFDGDNIGGWAAPLGRRNDEGKVVFASGEIVINATLLGKLQDPPLRRDFLRRVLVHEWGHVVGLNHPPRGPAVMMHHGGSELAAGDRYGLWVLGAGSPCLTTPTY